MFRVIPSAKVINFCKTDVSALTHLETPNRRRRPLTVPLEYTNRKLVTFTSLERGPSENSLRTLVSTSMSQTWDVADLLVANGVHTEQPALLTPHVRVVGAAG